MQVEKKIKIIFFLHNLGFGGTEKSTSRLIRNLDRKKFEIILLLRKLKSPHFLNELPTDILIEDLNTDNFILAILKLIKYLKKEKPNIFVSALPRENLITLMSMVFYKSKTKFIITERSTVSALSKNATYKFSHKFIFRFILPILMKIFYKKADSIVCVSKGVADDLYKIIGKLPSIRIIYNPVINNNVLELAKEPLIDSNIKNSSLPNIVAVGRLTKAKDYPTMLKAFSIVLKETPANLIIIGDGEERSKVENIIKELNISNNVFLLGFQKNPLKYMTKADIFILSSRLEGFPNVLVEAMACGVPVVSTDCQSGPNEIIEDGKSGLLVPVGDEKAISEAIIKLLENPDLRNKFSEEGKKRAQYFSVEKSVKDFEKLFL